MKTKILYAALMVAMLVFYSQVGKCEEVYAGPDDPKAIAAAKEAVAKGRYYIASISEWPPSSLTYFQAGIVGIPDAGIAGIGAGFKGEVGGIEGILKDLKAKKVGQKVQISLSGDVIFDFDKWNIRPEAEKTLIKVAKAIKGMKVKHVLIEGHTDSKGSEQYNLRLSQLRADSVKAWLVQNSGVPEYLIETKGYGESRPVAPNTNPDGSDNPQGRAKNRRVEIYLTVEE